MKNIIKYFYNLSVTDFKKNKDIFTFVANKNEYIFLPFFNDLKKLYDIYFFCERNNICCHKLIFNKDGSLTTKFNDKNYILIRKILCKNRELNLSDILNFSTNFKISGVINWKELWEQKIDYYEYQMSQLSFKYPMLKESFNYYVGVAETAISLLNYVDERVDYHICHYRIRYKEKLEEVLNPMNMIMDAKVRDIAEYIKINFIYNNIECENVYSFLTNYAINNSEAILFLSRMIYPSYYFDMYDLIIQDKISENEIKNIIKRNTNYEVFLKDIYLFMRKKYMLPEIEWLK